MWIIYTCAIYITQMCLTWEVASTIHIVQLWDKNFYKPSKINKSQPYFKRTLCIKNAVFYLKDIYWKLVNELMLKIEHKVGLAKNTNYSNWIELVTKKANNYKKIQFCVQTFWIIERKSVVIKKSWFYVRLRVIQLLLTKCTTNIKQKCQR